jgi:hypothetical protein
MAVTNTASSTTSAVVLAAGNDRETVILCNSDANDCYILLESGTAAASNMSLILEPKANAQVPQEYVNGAISAVWAADGSGYLHITTR